jgi:hypothetical protein
MESRDLRGREIRERAQKIIEKRSYRGTNAQGLFIDGLVRRVEYDASHTGSASDWLGWATPAEHR